MVITFNHIWELFRLNQELFQTNLEVVLPEEIDMETQSMVKFEKHDIKIMNYT